MEDEEYRPSFLPTAETSFLDFTEMHEVQTRRKRGPLKRDVIAHAYQDAFELIGGVPRLALFAHSDPEAFYKLHARLIPSEQKTQFDGHITLEAAVRPTLLDVNVIPGEKGDPNASPSETG